MSQPASDDTAPPLLAKPAYVSDGFKQRKAAQKAAEKEAEVAAKAGKPEEAGGSGVKRRADSPPDVRVSKAQALAEPLAQAQAQAHALQTKLHNAEKQVRDLKTSLGLGYEAHMAQRTNKQENARLQAENARLQAENASLRAQQAENASLRAQLAEMRRLCLNGGVAVKSMCKTCGHPVFEGQRRGLATGDSMYFHADGQCDQHMHRSVEGGV